MKEKEFIKIIKDTLNSKHIGDDCAYLKDLGITISQDTLVEDIHFIRETITAYQLGYKSAMVNLSDIAASGAEPKYMTVGLSLPKNINNEFVKDFYQGIKNANKNIEVVGGDITSSDKIFISICVIGITNNRKISSRSNAKIGYKIITSGFHGSSAAGLREILNNNNDTYFINSHIEPKAQIDFSKNISTKINEDYAMMDTSDGLMDALYQIAEASKVCLSVDFKKIPYDKKIEKYNDFKDLIFYGGEDYQLIACVPKNFEIPNSYTIGEVKEGCGVEINSIKITNINEKIYNHFEGQK